MDGFRCIRMFMANHVLGFRSPELVRQAASRLVSGDICYSTGNGSETMPNSPTLHGWPPTGAGAGQFLPSLPLPSSLAFFFLPPFKGSPHLCYLRFGQGCFPEQLRGSTCQRTHSVKRECPACISLADTVQSVCGAIALAQPMAAASYIRSRHASSSL